MGGQGTEFISDLDPGSSLNPATHLAINNSGSNLIHELRYDLGILVFSRVTRILDAIGHVS